MKIVFTLNFFLAFSLFASCSCEKYKEQQMKQEEEKVISCLCPKDYRPVCGEDGITYSNACNAECNKIKILHHGHCLKETQK